jgi:hypothetical protein
VSVYVFLGPTLPEAEARARLNATYLPPVACGDVLALMVEKPIAIGIIDGYFDLKPSVFHKEILYALSQGVRVFGASSMGALRAAELHPFGMEGVGKIFEAYRSGALEDDDEVAVVHGTREAAFVAYSDAMVNLRDAIERARERGIIGGDSRDALVGMAKESFYAERSWPRLLQMGKERGVDVNQLGRLSVFVERERPNLKRDDALLLLDHMRMELAVPSSARTTIGFELKSTVWWKRLCAEVERAGRFGQRLSDGIPARAIELQALLHDDADRTLLRDALLLCLVADAAERNGLEADPSAPPVDKLEMLAEKLRERLGDRVSSFLPLILEQRGLLANAIKRAARQREYLATRGLSDATLETHDADPEAVLAWYRNVTGAREESLEVLAAVTGIAEDEVANALLRSCLFATRSRE